ncbi:UNVERIFIED_CONTAM: hypothetical protein GTU68_051634, partial [Idotea baltica]|nr:hypothetical protein [Idotea baltica]
MGPHPRLDPAKELSSDDYRCCPPLKSRRLSPRALLPPPPPMHHALRP